MGTYQNPKDLIKISQSLHSLNNMKCFLYCRKSSEDQSRQVQSIGDQKNILLELAKVRNLEIVEIFTDEKSAGTPYQRTGFQALIQRIQSGEASTILTWKIDRLSRNPIENGQISWMLQQGTINEIITPDRTYLPDDNVLLYMVEGAMANQYLRDLSTNVKRGMHSKVERGIYPAYAPLGYLNEGKHKGTKQIIPDPKYFPKLQALWDLLKTGQYQLADLYRIMQEKYPIDKHGSPVAFSTFHRIFHNPFYCGLFRWGGKQHLGTHKTMVTQSEFEQIQNCLNKKSKTRKKELIFEYKGAFNCGTCDALITAERKQKLIKSKNIHKVFDYYRCAHHRRHIQCNEKPLSKSQIEVFLFEEIEKIHLPESVIRFGIESLKREDSKESELCKKLTKGMQRERQELLKNLKMVENNLAFEPDPEIRELMKQKHTELKVRIRKLDEDKISLLEQSKRRNEEISVQLEILGRAGNILISDDRDQKMRLLNVLGSNWQIKDKKLLYEPNYICEAIVKVRNSMPEKFSMLEPKKTCSIRGQGMSDACVSLIWRSVWELIRNSDL